MQINSLNHCNENNREFELIPARLVYLAGREAHPGHHVEITEAEQLEKSHETAKKDLEKKRKKIIGQINNYNKKFTESGIDKKEEPHKESLVIDENFDNLGNTIAQIDRILSAPYLDGGKWQIMSYADGQGARLLELRNMLTNSNELHGMFEVDKKFIEDHWNSEWEYARYNQIDIYPEGDKAGKLRTLKKIAGTMSGIIRELEEDDPKLHKLKGTLANVYLQIHLLETSVSGAYAELDTEFDKGTESLAMAHGDNLREQMDIIRTMMKQKSVWESRPAYTSLKRAFDAAKGDNEFKDLFDVPDGGISTQKQRESELLFFAILASETNDFRSDFILGEEFGENHTENKKRFPYIYNEWMKEKGVDPKEFESLDTEVEAKKGILRGNKIEVNLGKFLADIQPDAGISENVNKIAQFDTLARPEKWSKTEAELNKIVYKLNRKAKTADKPSDKKGFKEKSKQVELHRQLAQAEYERAVRGKRKAGADIEFTRSNLNTPENRQILMELAMKKYMKAMKMVDQPFGKGSWRHNYHPMTRRLLIASVYDVGVSEYRLDAHGKDVYNENLNPDYYWMLAELSKSEYFNAKEYGKHLDERHRGLLLVARLANKVSMNLSEIPYTKNLLNELIAFKSGTSGLSEDKLLEKLSKEYSAELIGQFMQRELDELRDALEYEEKKEKLCKKFLESAKNAIKNPFLKETETFITAIKEGEYNNKDVFDIISKKDFEHVEKHLHEIEFDNRAFELQEKSRMQYFERLGIRLEGLYEGYLIELKKNPDMNVDNWDDYLTPRDESKFRKLYNMLDAIIPPSNLKGKEDFLAVFETLQGDRGSLDPEHRNDQASAIAIYTMIKLQIKHAERVKAAEDRGETELLAKLNGMTIGDKITEYAKGVWGMAFGPGQSLANRGAGLVLLFAGLKMANKAWKGEGTWGKALRALFLVGAGELAVKHITGRGIVERMGLDTIAEAIEGTRKAVLVQQGRESMEKKDISEEQHSAALYELDKIPFKDVMHWYKNSNKESGGLNKGQPNSIWTKLRINTGAIIKEKATWDPVNRDLEARGVIMHTVRNFFEYVGAKDDKGEIHGAKMLEERWGRMLDPNFKPDHTEFDMATSIIKEYGKNPEKLTWRTVMENEIDLHHVDETVGKNGLQPITDAVSGMGETIMRWGRKEVYGPLAGHIETFAKSAGIKVDEFKKCLTDVGESLGSTLHFTKESIGFWWEGNQYEVRRVLGQHWELVVEAVKLPFGVIYEVDQMFIPWTLKGLRQLKAIARRRKFTTIQRNIEITDILQDGKIIGTADQIDAIKNPGFATFGHFQVPFAYAFDAGKIKKGEFTQEAYHMEETSKIGYFVSETSMENAGISPSDTTLSESDIFNKMEKQAYEDAMKQFRKRDQDLSMENVKDHMYPIHVIKKTTKPKKLYTFWRMPLSDSAEFDLKTTGQWADYENPNFYKNRVPFYADASKSFGENLYEAFAKSIDPDVKTVIGGAGKIIAQGPRLILGTLQAGGGLLHTILNIDKTKTEIARGDERIPWASKEATTSHSFEQQLDEFFTSGTSQALAVSDFYKNKDNRDSYRCLLDFARTNDQELYLGLLEGWPKYDSHWYKNKPGDFKYSNLQAFYEKWAKEGGNRKIPKFDTAIKKKVTAENRGEE